MKFWFSIVFFFFFSFISQAAPLPADQVFQINTHFNDANSFSVQWQIKPGYFIYKDRIRFQTSEESNVEIAEVHFPKNLVKIDKQGQSYKIYRDNLNLTIPVLGIHPGESLIDVHYQGCSDEGFCYPPETGQIKVTVNSELALSAVSLESPPSTKVTPEIPKDKIKLALDDHHWLVSLMIFFGFGLLLSFTPCVLPMVPVLSGIIVGHGKEINTSKAFLLSLSYVLSMSVTYALVGAGVALLGQNIQIAMQSPWAISLFSLSFVLLSLSMFGVYELRLPNSLQTKLAGLTRSQSSGHYVGAAIMGALSTLILSPCVTAPLIGVLGYIANTGNVIFGILTLFFLGLGMGTPLLLIGTQAGRWLPTAGNWMIVIKNFFGLMLLGVAIYLMSRILPAALTMVLWAALFIFAGLNLARHHHSKLANRKKISQGFAVVLMSYGLFILVGASMGQTNPLQPLSGFKNNPVSENMLNRQIVRSVSELELALNQAKGKPVIVDFYADWCTACAVMEATTFKNPQLQQALKNFVWLKADVTANSEQEKNLLKKYGIIAPPSFLFFDAKGEAIPSSTLVGEVSAKGFLAHLKAIP